jgi:hypothetical protein
MNAMSVSIAPKVSFFEETFEKISSLNAILLRL